MEDFIEIIFYVVILVLSGIGSLMKNKKKEQKSVSVPKSEKQSADSELEDMVVEMNEPNVEEENELIRMLREAAAVAEAQQREKEALEQRQRDEELRQKEEAERKRKAEFARLEKDKEQAKRKVNIQNENLKVENKETAYVFDLNLSDVDEARRAFIASEIFNKKYC